MYEFDDRLILHTQFFNGILFSHSTTQKLEFTLYRNVRNLGKILRRDNIFKLIGVEVI